jgi:hypothetical protein
MPGEDEHIKWLEECYVKVTSVKEFQKRQMKRHVEKMRAETQKRRSRLQMETLQF